MTEYIPLVDKDEDKRLHNEIDQENEELNSLDNSDDYYKPQPISENGYGRRKDIRKINKICYSIVAVFYITWVLLYKNSLRGGTMYYIQDHLLDIAVVLSVSFFIFSVNLWIIAFMYISKVMKTFLYIIHILPLLILLIIDHGEMFDKHGIYNFILFCIYFVLFDGLALILYLWFRFAGKKRFIIQFSSFIIAFVIFESISLSHYINIWGKGYNGREVKDGEGLCKLRRPIPWFDLLPRGTQNFWLGSRSCKRRETFNAYFDPNQDNKLVVTNCPKDKKITYKILPETRLLSYEEKRFDFKINVVDKMEEKVFDYTEPVDLKDVEAVYVNCGEKGKLLVRVAQRRVDPVKEEQPVDKLNVLIMYFDAVSRRQFLRSLPKTVKVIEKISKKGVTHLNQFFRYGVVGYNTLKNSNALYAGRQYKEDEKGVPIWEVYRNRGYVTGAADNICEDWDTVYNNRTALSNDHELISPFCLPEYHERNGSPWGNFKGPFSLRRRCITGQYVHNYALNYTKDFIKMYDGTNPWFFRSSYIEGHESTTEVLNTMDNDLADFFGSLSDETLKRTAIIIMSDHGLHMGFAYLFSNQGRTEHKLPMLTSLIPEQFLDKYPDLRKNLDENEQKLVSGFDVYATFRDILDFDINKEPKDKLGIGIDISEAKITDKVIGRRNLYKDWNEDRNLFSNNDYLEEKFENLYHKREEENKEDKENKKEEYHEIKNSTIVWGKSILRKIPYNRKCEGILIHTEHCVCR